MDPPISPTGKPDYNIHVGKDRAYNSQAKGAIYGAQEGQARPEEKHLGKKMLHGGKTTDAPFATYKEAPAQGHQSQNKPVKKEGSDKVGSGAVDNETYAQARRDNISQMEKAKSRNYGGNNIFGN